MVTTAAAGSGCWHYYRSVARVGIQVAEALEHAHREGVLHRDIKPSNLLLDPDGRVWVTDFGLAKTDGEALTHAGDVIGTIPYMAPERFRGWSDPRSDVYSLGLTLYEMVALHPAFAGSDRVHLIAEVAQRDPPRLKKLDPHAPRDLRTIIAKAIDKEPGRRYQTAAELADDLRRFLEDRPIRARQTGPVERGWRWCRRNPAVAAWSAAFVLVLVVGLIGVSWQLIRALEAEKQRTEQLWQSDFERARALINSGMPGQRRESLKAVASAAQIRPTNELRDLAIASLARTDIRLGKEWVGFPDGNEPDGVAWPAFDAKLERYARVNPKGVISILRIADNQELFSLQGPESLAWLCFSPDGTHLAALYGSGRLQVWDLPRRTKVLDPPATVEVVVFTPDSRQLVVAGLDGSTNLYDVATGACRTLGRGPERPQLAVNPDSKRFAVAGHESLVVEVRDLDTGALLSKWSHPAGGVYDVAWHPHDHNLLATAGAGIFLWDARTGKKRAELAGQAGPTTNIAFSHGGDILASKGWGSDTTLRLWDPWTGRQLVQIPGTVSNSEVPIQFSPDDRKLAFAVNGRQIGLWDLEIAREYRSLAGRAKLNEGNYVALDISPDGRVLAAASRHGPSEAEGVRLWKFATGREVGFLPIGRTQDVRFLPRGDGFITVHDEAGVQFWPIRTEPASDIWRVGPPRSLGLSGGAHLSLSQDGRRLAVTHGWDASVTVLAVPDPAQSPPAAAWPGGALGQKLQSWIGPDRPVTISHPGLSTAALSPDGRWLATGGDRGQEITIWDARSEPSFWNVRSREPVRTLPPLLGRVRVEFSPDGKWLVARGPYEYRIYKVDSWQLQHRLPRNLGGDLPGPLAFSRDSKVLAVAPSSFTVRLLDPETGREFANLEPPERDRHIPRILRFSPDGNQLAACVDELQMIHAWDLRLIGERLAGLGLPWELPLPPPAPVGTDAQPLRVEVDLGSFSSVASREQRRKSREHLNARRWQQALDEAKVLPEGDVEGWVLRGRARYELRQDKQALADFDRALKLIPGDPEASHYRGHCHENLGHYREAVADFTAALKRAPADAHLLTRRGVNRLRLGESDAGVADLRKALESKPPRLDKVAASNALARVLVAGPEKLRDPARALALAEQAEELEWASFDPVNALGVVYYRLGEYEKARDKLTRAAALSKQTPTAENRFFLAMCQHRLGETAAARASFDQGVAQLKARPAPAGHPRETLDALRAEAEALLNSR